MNSNLARMAGQRATAAEGSPIALANLTTQSDGTSQNIHTVSHVQPRCMPRVWTRRQAPIIPRNAPDQVNMRLANLVGAYAANSEITLVGGRPLVIGAFCAIACQQQTSPMKRECLGR